MDEITIGDKVYVSSKQAAKITGYAKDYIGQLCREGRVEARLVGRNWYVLDSAIREHRFGKEEEKVEVPEKPAEMPVDRVSTWQKPQYVAETASFVPDLVPKAAPSPAVADMQSAWKEWFEEKKQPLETLSDGQEDFKEEYLPVIVPDAPVAVENPPVVAEEEEPVMLSRIEEQPAYGAFEAEAEEEEKVELHRSYNSFSEGETIPVSSVPVVDLTTKKDTKHQKEKRQKPAKTPRESGNGMFSPRISGLESSEYLKASAPYFSTKRRGSV